jgi:hypothetical protein
MHLFTLLVLTLAHFTLSSMYPTITTNSYNPNPANQPQMHQPAQHQQDAEPHKHASEPSFAQQQPSSHPRQQQ